MVFTVALDHGSRPAPNESGSGVDHICFSGDSALVPPGWAPRPLPYRGVNAAQTILYVASHPAALLGEYDTTVWISPKILGGRSTSPVLDALEAHEGSLPDWACLPSRPHGVESSLARLRETGVAGTAPFHELLASTLRSELSDLVGVSTVLVRSNRSSRASALDRAWWSTSLATSANDDTSLHLASAATEISTEHLSTDFQQAQRSVRAQQPVVLGRARSAAFDAERERERVRTALGRWETSLRQTPSRLPSCAVVVPVHNAPEFTERCLESVVATVGDHVNVFIVDDGSASETADVCERFANDHHATVIRNDNGSGFGAAANRGLDAARGHEHIVVLNSDTVVPRGWIERLQTHLLDAPTVGAIGPLSNDARHQSIPHASDSNADWAHHQRNEPPNGLDLEAVNCFLAARSPDCDMVRVPVLNGFCLMLTRTALDLVGGFDTELFPRGYGEEVDWCFRAVDAGVELAVALDTYVYHAKSRSYTADAISDLKTAAAANLSGRWGEMRPKLALRALERSEALRSVRGDTEMLFVLAADSISARDGHR